MTVPDQAENDKVEKVDNDHSKTTGEVLLTTLATATGDVEEQGKSADVTAVPTAEKVGSCSTKTKCRVWVVVLLVGVAIVAAVITVTTTTNKKAKNHDDDNEPDTTTAMLTVAPTSSPTFVGYESLDSEWKPLRDWRVEAIDSSYYELVDYLNTNIIDGYDQAPVLARTQGNMGNTTNLESFASLQPTPQTQAILGDRAHLQTLESHMILQPAIDLRADSDWTLSFAGAAIPRNDSSLSSFDIILGPTGLCNSQLRYESSNEFGFFTCNAIYEWHEQRTPLPKSNYEFHILTMTQESSSGITRLYQDEQLVWLAYSKEEEWAQLAYVGSWFQGRYASQIVVSRIVVLETAVKDIERLVEIMKTEGAHA